MAAAFFPFFFSAEGWRGRGEVGADPECVERGIIRTVITPWFDFCSTQILMPAAQ